MRLKQPLIKQPEHIHSIHSLIHAASYRIALPVTQMVKYPTRGYCYPICPRCKRSMDREYVSFCDRCGQKLDWGDIDNAQILTAPLPW